MKTVGVIGGMGPQATIRFYQRMIAISQQRFGASRNADFPHMLLSNLPVPDLVTNRRAEQQAVDMVLDEARALERANADFLVLACNTMHLFTEQIRQAVAIPFLSMIDLVTERLVADGMKKVAVLGSITTLTSELYARPLYAANIDVVMPSPDTHFSIGNSILRIIANQQTEEDTVFFCQLIATMKQEQEVQGVVLGCTELPLILPSSVCGLPLYSSLDILAESVCAKIYN